MDIYKYYMIRASNGLSVIVYRGDGPPTITAGGGRWTQISRPRRVSTTRWEGLDPYKLDVPILFDGWGDSDSVEDDIAKLNQMKQSSQDLVPPPTIRVDGALPVKGALWVIEDITWGTNVIWHADGDNYYRYRQDAIVHLAQFVQEETLAFNKPTSTTKLHIVKSGETLRSIAKKHYGDAKKASLVKKANNIRDPKTVKPGHRLKIPHSTTPNTGMGASSAFDPGVFDPVGQLTGKFKGT